MTLAPARMGRRLTTPFARGADTLDLRLQPSTTIQATVAQYGFDEHVARFGRDPQPRYVLVAQQDVATTVTVKVTLTAPGRPDFTNTIVVPAGTPAGASFALALPVLATGRLTLLTVDRASPNGGPELNWGLTALLGVTAAVLWVVGSEHDELRRQLTRVVAQHHLSGAVGPSLDWIGADLGVPRFPPLPYGVDVGTVALYHFAEPPEATTVADATTGHPGHTDHPGTIVDAVVRNVPGRYGSAFGFRSDSAAVTVPSSPAFDIPATASATVECFVRPDARTDGRVLGRRAGGTTAGWALAVGNFGRGIDNNLQLIVADGTNPPLTLFADMSLPSTAFSHVAFVLDRVAARLTLFIDGTPRDSQPLAGLGAVANNRQLVIGPGGTTFRGVIDEVRISAVARTDFAPVLGEHDEHYRARLRLFRRWALPTPANLATLLNEAVGTIGGHRDPIVVDDGNAAAVRGDRLVRVWPMTVERGESIDGSGRRRVSEKAAVGTIADEAGFDPAFLVTLTRNDVQYAVPPARVQVTVADALDRLVTLCTAEAGPGAVPSRLRIDAAYTSDAADLRATGRAVSLTGIGLAPNRLAALAHRAGFDFVRHQPGGVVYAACAPGQYHRIVVTPGNAGAPTDLDENATATLELRPPPPLQAQVNWLTVPCGPGSATIVGAGATATLTAEAPGMVAVRVEVTVARHPVSATATLRVGIADLANNASIAADGTRGVPATAFTVPDDFHQAFLIRHDVPGVDYGGVENNRRMQPVVGELLSALRAELTRRGTNGTLQVRTAFDPAGDAAAKHGRALTLRHSSLGAGQLAAAAFAVGFGQTTRSGTDVQVRHGPGHLVVVRTETSSDHRAVIELQEGEPVPLTISPTREALRDAGVPGPVANAGPRLGWATVAADSAAVTLGSTTQDAVTVTGVSAGSARVQASYLIGDRNAPYTFTVRLKPALDADPAVISKDQYDLIMNVLNTLHPAGVEVNTAAIRKRVIEVNGDLVAANPDYTYPKFRVRGAQPLLRKDSQ